MKTYCKGLEFTRKSVVEALHRWKKSDSGKENGWRVADEYGTETAFVDRIWLELSTETLTFEPIRTYLKHDPNNGKLREISVESIKRQVCNYLCVGARAAPCRQGRLLAGVERRQGQGRGAGDAQAQA